MDLLRGRSSSVSADDKAKIMQKVSPSINTCSTLFCGKREEVQLRSA
jgi:hypothetical protein